MRPIAGPALLACVMLASARAQATGALPTSEAHEVVHVPPPPEPLRGPRFAPVTLEVFVAVGHPSSTAAAELVRRALGRNPDARAIVHLSTYGPPGCDLAAEALWEAHLQGRFDAFLDRLVRERQVPGESELVRLGGELGLDGARLSAALSARTHRARIEERTQDARAHGHVPGELLVNLDRYSSWVSDDALEQAIRAARLKAELLLDAGVPLGQLYDQLVEEHKRRANEETRPALRRRVTLDTSHQPARGPSLAPVTIVLFSNLACGPCNELAEAVHRVRARHPGAVREVFVSWAPPYAGLSPEGYAAELAAAAAMEGRFWALYDLALPGTPGPRARPSRADLDGLARLAGLDPARIAEARRGGTLRAALERDQAEARRLGISFGPAVLVNGILVAGGPDRLADLVDEELRRGLYERLSAPPPAR